jgi:hypothetical protein
MARTLTIAQGIAKLAEMTIAVREAEKMAMERACQAVEAEAKREIGHYQDAAGPFAEWPALAASTLAEKTRLGYAPPDNPLLRTGEMRDSIGHAVDHIGMGRAEGVVGTNSEIAEYQELGTSKIPPRSFLGGAAVRKGADVAAILGGGVVSALVGRSVAIPISGGGE